MPLIQCVDCGRGVRDRPRLSQLRRTHRSLRHHGPPSATSVTDPQPTPRPTASGVRAGVNQAELSQQSFPILMGQILLASIPVGIATQSWWAGAGTFFALLTLFSIPKPRTIMAARFALIIVGAVYVGILRIMEFSPVSAALVALFVGLPLLGINLAALGYSNDIGT